MSTIGISASGARSLSSTIGGQQSTSASIPTLADDNLSVQTGPGEARILLPLNARLELIAKEGSKDRYLRLILPTGGGSMFIAAREGLWPHLYVSAGKHLTDFYDGYDVVEVVHERVGDLIPPTEE